MSESSKTAVIDTNDEGLRHLTFERMKVFAKFTAADCAICNSLGPHFERFASEEEAQGILFIRLSSDENPVARQLMNQRAAPFFVSYCQGRILECNTLQTDQEVREQLRRLRLFLPDHA